MLRIEDALLVDICLGYPFGKMWLPCGYPEVEAGEKPDTFLLKSEQLAIVKELVKRKDSAVKRVVEGLRNQADIYLNMTNPSVVNKPSPPKGVGLQDYCSFAKYWWPNPDTEDGLPYIRRDGEVNPLCYSENSDLNRLDSFSQATLILSLAAYITDDRSYASKARSLIYTWFVDSKTRQTPHFRYAQIIMGKEGPNFPGVVEARRLIYVCEAIQLLKKINGISTSDYQKTVSWFSKLLQWFETSDQAQKAQSAKNNIGFWTDLQRLIYARFCGDNELAKKIVRTSVIPRINLQVESDGRLLSELTRAKPYDYIAFTLLAMAGLSAASEHNELKLAEYPIKEGRAFQNAFKWFNETIESNDLKEKGLALGRLVALQQKITQLRDENESLERSLRMSEDKLKSVLQQITALDMTTQPSDTGKLNVKESTSQRLSERLRKIQKENSFLRSELIDNNWKMMSTLMYYRGVDFFIKDQAEVIKSINQKIEKLNAKVKEQSDQLYQNAKEIKRLEAERDKFNNEYRKIKESRSWKMTSPIRKISTLLKLAKKMILRKNNVPINKKRPHIRNIKNNDSVRIKNNDNKKKKSQENGKKAKAEKRITLLLKKINNLGFSKRGLAELEDLVLNNSYNKYLKHLASWELALWHANQGSKDGARKCLQLLQTLKEDVKDKEFLRKIVVIEAECKDLLGDKEGAKYVILDALQSCSHPDLFLAAANLESSLTKRIELINKALGIYGISSISLDTSNNRSVYDSLRSEQKQQKFLTEVPKVTVIIPAYNAESGLKTTLDSVLNQTWGNLEVLVIDDCSTDGTVSIVEEYISKDSRVQLIQAESNGGAYVARNLGLRAASGDYVTINDADDWSHPEKIEKQMNHLLENPSIIGNTSEQARATNDLRFYRRGKPGYYIFNNMSSFLFRRKQVMEKIGFWDSVRFGADSEFIRRIKKVFGDDAVVELSTGPLSFQRQTSTSLTGNSAFGYHGFFMGARKEYFDSYINYHNMSKNLRYQFPQESRPFAVPEPMLPTREGRRHFDVIIVSDFRLDGGSNISNLEEIKAHQQMGLRTGLIQMSRYDYSPRKKVNPRIRDLIDGDQVQMIVYGEKVSCDLLLLRYPPILQEWQDYIPEVEARNICVIVNQTPMSHYGGDAEQRYNIRRCEEHLRSYFGKSGVWYPIGPAVRKALHDFHSEDLNYISLADKDWSNIIDINEWKRTSRPKDNLKPRIGRHSRDSEVKWPAKLEELLTVYPESNDIEVHVLGGVNTPKKILGYIPSNWKYMDFGEMHPKEFLSKLDVFVYYTHPHWVESFGRVIIEAMAVGVPVILPPSYQDLFGEIAICVEADKVQDEITRLMNDHEYYNKHVEKALNYVEEHFGYSMHARRLEQFLQRKIEGKKLNPRKMENSHSKVLRDNIVKAKREGAIIKYLDDIVSKKSKRNKEYFTALRYAARLYQKENTEKKREVFSKILSGLSIEEIPEFIIRNTGLVPLDEKASFRAFLTMRSMMRGVNGFIPELELSEKTKAVAFCNQFGIDKPWREENYYKASELPKKENIVIKPVRGAGSRGVYLVFRHDNIFDLESSETLNCWDALKTSITNKLDTGSVKNDQWIVEELVYENRKRNQPARDLKFFCFYGKVALILEITRFPEKRYCWWTSNGEMIQTGKYDKSLFEGEGVSKGQIELAASISSEIPAPFIRIDFLKGEEGMVFGEFTPRPGNYDMFDKKTDQMLGKYFLEAECRLVSDLLNGKQFTKYKNYVSQLKG